MRTGLESIRRLMTAITLPTEAEGHRLDSTQPQASLQGADEGFHMEAAGSTGKGALLLRGQNKGTAF